MAYLLRNLNLLVSSRYHACILSMQAGVPMVAVGHDLRLKELFGELDLGEDFFISYKDEKLFDLLSSHVDKLFENPVPVKKKIIESYNFHLDRAKRSKELLKSFISKFESNTGK
jgi:polysaccharide pyruvyl transferase WcaK-like protein